MSRNFTAKNGNGGETLASWMAPALIVLAGLLAYANSFQGEFVLDDLSAIPKNPTIRQLWPLGDVLFPRPNLIEEGNTVEGRPLLNLSFALNYAAGGTEVRGYHVVNLAIHLAAGLLLFGVARRTLLLPSMRERFGGASRWLAMVIALVWVVHPLQTESVTYVAQRAESLMGFFYLLTFYLAIRGFESLRSAGWSAGALAVCTVGMAAKEVMATAPLVLLFFDAAFVSGSLREAWRRRKKLYIAMMVLGWAVLGAILWRTRGSNLENLMSMARQFGGEGAPASPGHELHWLDYARMQFWAVARYLRLSIWPEPLILYYGKNIPKTFSEMWPSAVVVVLLLVFTMLAWRRCPKLGFLGIGFLFILAPTSSVIPLSGQPVAEHRMYLPLAAVVSLLVMGCHALWRGRHGALPAAVTSVVLLILGGMTWARNRDYRTALSIWQDSVSKWPNNSNAQNNLALALLASGKKEEAMSCYRKSLEINPYNPEAHNNLANALMDMGRADEAWVHYERSLQLKPGSADAHNNIGNFLLQSRQVDRAIAQFHRALELRPDFAEARNNLGNALQQAGKLDEAMEQYRAALQADPLNAGVHNNFGNSLLRKGRLDEALAELNKALELDPEHAKARNNLGYLLTQKGQVDEAMIHLRRAIELEPGFAGAHNNMGNAYFQKGQFVEARACFETACRLQPNFAEAHFNLGNTHVAMGRLDDGIREFEKSLEINPNYADAHLNLGIAHLQKGNERGALGEFELAIRLNPAEMRGLNNLAWILATSADDSVRDATRALDLAQKAGELAGGKSPAVLHTLAAAYAENGRFADADATAERALALARAQGNGALADLIGRTRVLYGSQKRLRDAKTAP